jgi:hypothetical protein
MYEMYQLRVYCIATCTAVVTPVLLTQKWGDLPRFKAVDRSTKATWGLVQLRLFSTSSFLLGALHLLLCSGLYLQLSEDP